MMVTLDPDEFESVSETHTCPYHQNNPNDRAWPGCTCSVSWGLKRRPLEEVAEIKRLKRIAAEDEILAKAEMIKARRRMGHG
jgi:hypothetical protein